MLYRYEIVKFSPDKKFVKIRATPTLLGWLLFRRSYDEYYFRHGEFYSSSNGEYFGRSTGAWWSTFSGDYSPRATMLVNRWYEYDEFVDRLSKTQMEAFTSGIYD